MTVTPTSVHPRPEQHRFRWVLVAVLAFLLGGLAVALLYQSTCSGARPTRPTRDPAYPRRSPAMLPGSTASNLRGATTS